MRHGVDVPLDGKRSRHVALLKREMRTSFQMCDVPDTAGNQIVQRDNRVTFRDQAVTKMGPDESGRAGNGNSQRGSSKRTEYSENVVARTAILRGVAPGPRTCPPAP